MTTRSMTATSPATYRLGDRAVKRLGYGAMQLAGPHVFGPPRDEDQARAVLRHAIARGVDHIDTSDAYGPYVTNLLIREALAPYPEDLVIVTKVGAMRGDDAAWVPAFSAADLTEQVHSNLANLGLERLEVVNLRLMFDIMGPAEGAIDVQMETLADLQRQGLIGHIGISNAMPAQVRAARKIAPIVCVQNQYNIVHRSDDALIDELAADGIAYVPFFPLGGFSPLQSERLNAVASELNATPMQVALAWLLQRAPNILLIPGTSSPAHLDENLAAGDLVLPPDAVATLDAIGSSPSA